MRPIRWVKTVADVRVHGTTKRIVEQHFAEELPMMQALPLSPCRVMKQRIQNGIENRQGQLKGLQETNVMNDSYQCRSATITSAGFCRPDGSCG